MSSALSVKLKIWEMFPKTCGNFFINHRRAFCVYPIKEGEGRCEGEGALLALVLALLPGMARSEAVFTREIDHVVSMETMEGGLLLSGSYADGEADRPSVKFLDFAGRRLYSRGDRAHDGGYADAALFDGGGCAVLRYGTRAIAWTSSATARPSGAGRSTSAARSTSFAMANAYSWTARPRSGSRR